jgi:hypothetical protein
VRPGNNGHFCPFEQGLNKRCQVSGHGRPNDLVTALETASQSRILHRVDQTVDLLHHRKVGRDGLDPYALLVQMGRGALQQQPVLGGDQQIVVMAAAIRASS